MFDVGAPELLVLIVIAVILFGPEKLPEFARKAARVVKYLRGMAGNAQQQLSKELGPGFEDIDVRDLNPKAFIQKHLLDDVEPVVAEVKQELTATRTLDRDDDAEDVDAAIHAGAALPETNGQLNGHTNGQTNGALHPRVLTPFDPDAT